MLRIGREISIFLVIADFVYLFRVLHTLQRAILSFVEWCLQPVSCHDNKRENNKLPGLRALTKATFYGSARFLCKNILLAEHRMNSFFAMGLHMCYSVWDKRFCDTKFILVIFLFYLDGKFHVGHSCCSDWLFSKCLDLRTYYIVRDDSTY